MVSLKVHNILDYIIALVLVSTPFVFGFSHIIEARNVFLVLGSGLAIYSLFTKYYYSIAKLIPIGVHMSFDVAAGLMAIVAPFTFDYRSQITDGQYWVHVILGASAMGLVALTRTRTEDAKTPEEKFETEGAHHTGPAHPSR